MTEPRMAYLVSRYPSVTHTFVVNEVRMLRSLGVRIDTASVRRVAEREVLGSVHQQEQRQTHALLPASIDGLLRAHARALLGSPRAYARTAVDALCAAHAGGRPRLWQLFYFGESILLWHWMTRNGTRHVHVHHANVSADVALLACRFGNRRRGRWTWSMTIHGPTELLDATAHKLAQKVASADAVICTSDFARSQIMAIAEPRVLPRIHRVRSGIDVSGFAPAPRSEAPAGAPLHVLCVAALSRRKGHRVLLDAIAALRRDGVPVRLTLAGDGAERLELEAQTAGLDLDDTVTFLGAVDSARVAELYRHADTFCLPSFSEGLPTVLMEAMASGLPVVASRIMGTPELVEDGHNGLLVHPGRPDLLAGALRRLAEEPELRSRLGQAARQRVLEEFDERDAAARLHAVLAPLLSEPAD